MAWRSTLRFRTKFRRTRRKFDFHTGGDDRATFDRCLDECETCVYWVDSAAVQLPRGAAFVAAGSSVDATAAGCRATVVDWEAAAAFCDAKNGGASYLNTVCL